MNKKPPARAARSRQKPARRKKTLFVLRDDRRYHISFRTFFTIFLIFLGGLGIAFSYAYIYDIKTQISSQRNALADQKETNAALRAEITAKYTLDEVARIATERLGMKKPDISQITYIHVPKQSYVVLNDDLDVPEKPDIWQIIVSFFTQIFNR